MTKTVPSGPVFQPDEVEALSVALDEVCDALAIEQNEAAREIVAARIIALAAHGECSPGKLRDELLGDANEAAG